MIDGSHDLPGSQQARQLGISRGSIYYLPRPVSSSDLALMRRIDELHMTYPFAGSRMLRDLLGSEGVKVGRLHVATLMKKMGKDLRFRLVWPCQRQSARDHIRGRLVVQTGHPGIADPKGLGS